MSLQGAGRLAERERASQTFHNNRLDGLFQVFICPCCLIIDNLVAGHRGGVCKGGRGKLAKATEALQICLILPHVADQAVFVSSHKRFVQFVINLKFMSIL